MKPEFIMLAVGVIFMCLWAFVSIISSSNKAIAKEQAAKAIPDFKTGKWSKEESIIAAFVTLEEPGNEDLMERLACKINRTPTAFKRKVKRMTYLNSDDVSAQDKETVNTLSSKLAGDRLLDFLDALETYSRNTSWVWDHLPNWK